MSKSLKTVWMSLAKMGEWFFGSSFVDHTVVRFVERNNGKDIPLNGKYLSCHRVSKQVSQRKYNIGLAEAG